MLIYYSYDLAHVSPIKLSEPLPTLGERMESITVIDNAGDLLVSSQSSPPVKKPENASASSPRLVHS